MWGSCSGTMQAVVRRIQSDPNPKPITDHHLAGLCWIGEIHRLPFDQLQ